MTSFISKKAHSTIRWTALLVALTATAASLLQTANIRQAYADDGGYPWTASASPPANCVDGTDCSQTYNWGYSLPCPSIDPSCTTYEYPNSTNPTAGMGDPWGMGVRNCTSYVAWKLKQVFNQDIISGSWLSAYNWNSYATSHGYSDDSSPQVGDIAQWDGTQSNPYGHVAYVFNVVNGVASFDEYNSGYPKNGSNLQWGLFYSGFTSTNYPSPVGPPNHYIHVGAPVSPSNNPSTPYAVARDSSDMAVFYNDGNSNLVNYSWNSNTSWTSQSWTDSGGLFGEPAAVARTSNNLDVFYTTGQHKLVWKYWSAGNSWSGPNVLLSSDVAGDPTVSVRDSNHMQVFYRTQEGDIKSISWDTGTWNTNPQLLYSSSATTDPSATSRSSDSMEVFFGKNNGNIVHLGWSSAYGWVTQDWTPSSGVTGKPSAIAWNSGGDMAGFFQESNNNVGEEAWDWQTNWAQNNWTASLAGSPSAIPGVSNTIDDFYRETGGNIVDRYLNGGTWATTNIVGSGSATGNPNAMVRDTSNEEVFYWNGTNLEDANYNTGRGSWSVSTIN